MNISGPNFSSALKPCQVKVNPISLENYIKKSSYSGGPIQMLVDEFNSGTQAIVLSDPHPACNVPEYSEFLKKLYVQLSKTSCLKTVMVEITDKRLKSLPDAIKTWRGSGISNYRDYCKHVEAKYENMDEVDMAHLLMFGPAEPWDFNEASEDELKETNEQKIAYDELSSLHFQHLLPMLELALNDEKSIVGFDSREDELDIESLTEFMSGKLKQTKKTNYTLDWNEYFKEKSNNVISGGSVDFDFYEKASDKLIKLNPQEKALIIVGTDHATKTKGLNRFAYFLSQKPGLSVKTILVEVGWWNELMKETGITRDDMLFYSYMRGINPGCLAINNNCENKELADIQVFESEKLSMFVAGQNPSKEPVLVGDFDKLIYFNSKKDLEQYLSSF